MKTLDSRDLNERLEELETAFNEWKECLTEAQISQFKQSYATEELSEEEYLWLWEDEEVGGDAEELKNLRDLRDQFGREWFDGVELIREQDFEEYAQNYAERIGAISGEERWPACWIDWEKAANSLMMDFSSVDYDGETYYFRG